MESEPRRKDEPTQQVYWARRALVLGVPLVLLIIGAVIFFQRQGPVTARATPTNSVAATSASPTPETPSQSASAVVAPATPVATPPATSAPPSTAAAPATCDPGNIRLGLAGTRAVKLGTTQAFTATVINGSDVPCQLKITEANYKILIVSGTDRVWSTADCVEWLPAVDLVVQPQAAAEFKVDWTTQRSATGCKLTGGLGAGTYVATATFEGSVSTGRVVMDLKK